MSQSLSRVNLHIIFSTKNRLPLLADGIQANVWAYMATIARRRGSDCFRVGGTVDHAHLACTLPRTISQSDFLREIKSESSRWLRQEGHADFRWQSGYGCFSISNSHLERLIGYIDNQVEHHKNVSFQDEFREFLERYNVDYDERYVWD